MTETPAPQPAPQPAPAPLSSSDERTWAMLAHLSVLLNLVTGMLGVAAAFVIFLFYKDRSRYVAYHALQATLMQLVGWVGGGVLVGISWALVGVGSAFVVGLLCIPVAMLLSLLPLGAVVYGVIAGIACSQGKDFKYWLVGDWARNATRG
jgi:uncharacterized protein